VKVSDNVDDVNPMDNGAASKRCAILTRNASVVDVKSVFSTIGLVNNGK